MMDSAVIRKQNFNRIRRTLWSGKTYTKQQIARLTGLSVATCSKFLNEMEQSGEVSGEKHQLQGVGRSSMVYRVNENYETFLCVCLDIRKETRKAALFALSPTGRLLQQAEEETDRLDTSRLLEIIRRYLSQYRNVSVLVLGVCGTTWQGVIRNCDIPELNGEDLKKQAEEAFGIPVWMENDMHLRAYGYYKNCGREDDVVTLAYFPEHFLPGTASIHGGTMIRGSREFAGMVGFLSEGANRAKLPQLMDPKTALPLLIRSAVCITVMINPGRLVLTGSLVNEENLKAIREGCAAMVPEEYLPEFYYEPDPFAWYLEGMYHRAADLKIQIMEETDVDRNGEDVSPYAL